MYGGPACGPLAEEQEGKYSTNDSRSWLGYENRIWRINPGEIVPQQLMIKDHEHLFYGVCVGKPACGPLAEDRKAYILPMMKLDRV